MADAQLLPSAEDLDNILRYETTIERHFERKLQQLVSWRRARAEVVEALGQEKGNREKFLGQLDAEIASFEDLRKLHEKNETDVAGPLADAQLLPSAEDLDNILRYETTIERHFERKLQQLVSWRRARAEVVPPNMRTS